MRGVKTGPVPLTQRLVLAPLGHEALFGLHALLVDLDVRRYLLDGCIVDERWTLPERQERFLREGIGLWGRLLRAGDGALLGFTGLHPFDRHAQKAACGALR